MATIKDVARLAGVSVATCLPRQQLSQSQRSFASVRGRGDGNPELSPQRERPGAGQQSTETVGLVVGDVSDPFFGAMVKAVEQVAYRTGNFC